MSGFISIATQCLLLIFISQVSAELPTVTVRGFLNFRTTVDGTLIAFTPASAAAAAEASSSKQAAIASSSPPSLPPYIQPSSSSYSFSAESRPLATSRLYDTPWSSSAHVWPSYSTAQVRSYSSQYVRPTPSSTIAAQVYPTGLVTVISSLKVLDDTTTVFETSVVGTYIEGKYAQILKSKSSVKPPFRPSLAEGLIPGIIPTRTFANFYPPTSSHVPHQPEPVPDLLEKPPAPVFDGGNNNIQASFRTAERTPRLASELTRSQVSPIRRPGRLPWEKKKDPVTPAPDAAPTTERSRIRRPNRLANSSSPRPGRFSWTPRQTERVRLGRFKVKPSTSSITLKDKEEEEAAKEINQRLARRLGVSRQPPAASTTEQPPPATVTPAESKYAVYNPPLLEGVIGGDFHEDALRRPGPDGEPAYAGPDGEESEISPDRVIKEVQTVTSELTRDVGGRIKVDTVTFTTTVERTLHPSEPFPSDGIIGTSIAADANDLDASSIQETPPIVISRTSLVHVFDGTSTTTHTVTESFLIRKLITAYKTMPPGDLLLLETAMNNMNDTGFLENLTEAEQFVAPTLFHGTLGLMPSISTDVPLMPTDVPNQNNGLLSNMLQPSMQGPTPQFDLNNPLIIGAALRNPQLAALYFGLQQLGQQATQLTTITKPTQYHTTETVFNTKVLSFYDGRNTRTRTIFEPGSTISKTVTTTVTEVSSIINPQILVQQQQLSRQFASQLASVTGTQNQQQQSNQQQNQNQYNNNQNQFNNQQSSNQNPFNFNFNQYNPNQQQSQPNQAPTNQLPTNFNPFNNQQQQQQFQQVQPSTVTSHITTVITTTETNSKTYTLVYNALSTKYRTVTSTSVFPTTVTTDVTHTITPTQNPFAYFG